jgi:homoserine O-acetyltransferase
MFVLPTFFGHQQFAALGDLPTEDGGTIRDAVVGYQTFGRLNDDRSNAVLALPWFQGTSAQMAYQIGEGRLIDSSKYFVIVVDPLGNGVSTSPSNSRHQPGVQFPRLAIGDMVDSQYQLIRSRFGIGRLHAVVGVSMGGMQVFEWITRHPDMMEKAVSIVGSPQSQADDRERCQGIVQSASEPLWPRARHALLKGSPRAVLHELRRRPDDEVHQAQAIANHDIARAFRGSMAQAVSAVRAELMFVSTWADRDVNPKPGFDFARALGAEVLELDGRCGHQAPSCDHAALWLAVGRFLDRP